jgi:mono/diheme cytochrome c family protein
MSSPVGLLASFDYVDSAVNAIGKLRAAGLKKITAYMPYPEHEIEEALQYDQSPVRVWALAGGLCGAAGGFAFTAFTSMDWPLVTGGKPILSIPAYVVISFEMMVLFGALSTVIGLFINSRLPYIKPMVVYDPEFSAGRFGIYVTVPPDHLDQARGILQGQDPAELREDPVGVAHAESDSGPGSGFPGETVGVAAGSSGFGSGAGDLAGVGAGSSGEDSERKDRTMLFENLKIFAVVLGTLATFTIVANSIPQVQSEVPAELNFGADVSADELMTSGEILYNGAGGCLACHGTGTRAPNLLTDHAGTGLVGVRCANRVAGEECKAYLYASMVDPNAYVVEGFDPIMPDMRAQLSNEQIWAMVAYLESVGGEVTVTGADIGAGDDAAVAAAGAPAAGGAPVAAAGPATASTDPVEIMTANTCFVCHQFEGGGVPLGPPFDGIGARVDADYIRESILDPTAAASEGYEAMQMMMPPIFGNQLTASQLEAIVQFLASQR